VTAQGERYKRAALGSDNATDKPRKGVITRLLFRPFRGLPRDATRSRRDAPGYHIPPLRGFDPSNTCL